MSDAYRKPDFYRVFYSDQETQAEDLAREFMHDNPGLTVREVESFQNIWGNVLRIGYNVDFNPFIPVTREKEVKEVGHEPKKEPQPPNKPGRSLFKWS